MLCLRKQLFRLTIASDKYTQLLTCHPVLKIFNNLSLVHWLREKGKKNQIRYFTKLCSLPLASETSKAFQMCATLSPILHFCRQESTASRPGALQQLPCTELRRVWHPHPPSPLSVTKHHHCAAGKHCTDWLCCLFPEKWKHDNSETVNNRYFRK